MELNNSNEIVEKLVEMFKNETKENPIKVKNFYHYLKQLNYILFLDEDGEVYWRDGNYKGIDDRLGATLFIDKNVFDEWQGENNLNYKVIDFDELVLLLQGDYTVNNTPVITTTILTWDDDPLYFKLDRDDISQFQTYVLMYNSISQKDYIIGEPSDNYPELLEVLKTEFGKREFVKNAFYIQILTPPQDHEDTVESFKPNTTYFSVVYDTFEDKFSAAECLTLQNRCVELAKDMGVELLIIHKDSQVGEMIQSSTESEFYTVS